MQLISYGGGEFLTGDDIATALLEYGRALGAEDKAEIVRMPIIGDDGFPTMATLLIGPASQIVSKSVRSAHPEPQDAEFVERLRRLTSGVNFPAGSRLEGHTDLGMGDDI